MKKNNAAPADDSDKEGRKPANGNRKLKKAKKMRAAKKRRHRDPQDEKPKAGAARNGFNAGFVREPNKIVDARTGRTALIDAIQKEDFARIEKLLNAGANPNKTTKDGKSPLHHAVKLGLTEVADWLLDAGAQINPRDKELKTPLFDALQSPEPLKTLDFLLEAGLDPDIPDMRGRIPLHDACEKVSLPVLRRLLEVTENPARPDGRNVQPLHLVCENGGVDAVQLVLFERMSVFASDNNGDSCLHIAAARPDTEVAEYLLTTEAAMLVNSVNLLGRTPLHLAVLKKHEKLACDMIAAGGNVNQPDNKGFTPLHEAAEANDLPMMRALIRHGADVAKSQKSNQTTPLILAIRNAAQGKEDSDAIIGLLLDNNADVNTADTDGQTPLMAAAAKGNDALVGMLLAAGADATARDRLGRNVLQHCAQGVKKETVVQMIDAGADTESRDTWQRTPLLSAVMANQTELVSALIEKGADVNAGDNDNNTALYYALQHRKLSLVDPLLKAGADPNIAHKYSGMTLLHIACDQGLDREVGKLIEAKADLKAKDKQGRTPLHVAVLNTYGQAGMVKKLLDAGADPALEDNNGHSAYDMACGLDKTQAVTLLKQALAKKGRHNVKPKPYNRWSGGGGWY
ncbi:MAG: hypothetical protein GC185_07565 [Alphaproteobacteria bacterium]|nr:hypothetical protein [Alphaproteobacteria bacterium]